jgi:hypothetical protein
MEVDTTTAAAAAAANSIPNPNPVPSNDPAALEGELRAAVAPGQADYARALAAAEAAELLIQVCGWDDRV